MTIEQGIKVFFKKLAINQNVWDDDLDLSYSGDIINVFINNVKDNITETEQLSFIFKLFEDFIVSGYNLNTQVSNYITFTAAEIKYLKRIKETKFRVRDFVSVTSNGSIIPIKYFTRNNLYELSVRDKQDIDKKIIELFLYYSDKDQADFDKLINLILRQTKNTIISIFNGRIKFIELYSKNYYAYLLKGYSTIFPSNLLYSYNPSSSILNTVNTSNNIFTQFYEIFDVIDEYHHTTDIIIKYLKMYQIIEYLITRTVIVKIQNNQIINNLFLREISSLSKLDDYDKKKVKQLFSNDETDLTNWFKSLLDNNSSIKIFVERLLKRSSINTANNDEVYSALLGIIYQLRNAIVHNKESETHLTIHNIEQYEGALKFIKELLKKLENILFDKIANFENSIKYEKPYLELY